MKRPAWLLPELGMFARTMVVAAALIALRFFDEATSVSMAQEPIR